MSDEQPDACPWCNREVGIAPYIEGGHIAYELDHRCQALKSRILITGQRADILLRWNARPGLAAATLEAAACIAEADNGRGCCPFATRPSPDIRETDHCPACGQTGLEDGSKCLDNARARIAKAIRAAAAGGQL